jgi:hypothetical protein
MDEKEMQETLMRLIGDEALADYFDGGDVDVRSVESFETEGVLTNNAGFVLRLMDGSEFQITILRSK